MLAWDVMRTDPAYRERLRAEGLDSVARVLGRVEGRVAAWSRSSETLHVPGHGMEPGLFIKRYYFPRWKSRIRGALRGTFLGLHRGHAEYLALRDMRWTGVPAVRPLAYGCRLELGFVAACVLITEEVPGAMNLTSFAQRVADGRIRLRPAERRQMIRSLAERISEMHQIGLSHGNLYWRNILVRSALDGSYEYFFLDARPLDLWERVRSRGEWWIHELAQLLVSAATFTSRADRLRFVKHYLGDRALTPALRRDLRRCEVLARAWGRHERHRIRMNRLFDAWSEALARENDTAARPTP